MSLTVKYLMKVLSKMNVDTIIRNEQNEDFIHLIAGKELRLSTTKPIGTCNRTGEYVYPSVIKGYSAFCPELDEDLYDMEWTTKKDELFHTTKKAFKEQCSFHEYGKGQNKRNAIYFDWKENDKGRGFKFMSKASVSQVKKKELFDMFYDWVIKDGLKPGYSLNKKAEIDEQRFKVSMSG